MSAAAAGQKLFGRGREVFRSPPVLLFDEPGRPAPVRGDCDRRGEAGDDASLKLAAAGPSVPRSAGAGRRPLSGEAA